MRGVGLQVCISESQLSRRREWESAVRRDRRQRFVPGRVSEDPLDAGVPIAPHLIRVLSCRETRADRSCCRAGGGPASST